MRLRNTIAAFLVLVALGAWIYVYEYRGEEGREKAAEALKKALPVDPETAEGLDILRAEGTIRLRKEGADWRLIEPIAARADADEVSALLSSLSWLEIDRKVGSGGDLAAYRLDAPAATIVLHPGGGKPEARLAIGDKAPIGSGYYARRDDGPDIVTVSSSVDRVLETTADKVRYKKVVGLDSWKVVRFTVEGGASPVSFAKDGEDWRIESPSPFPADRSKVSNLLYDLTSLAAEGFEPEGAAPAAVGLDRPAATLRLEEKEGAAVTVEFSAKGADGAARARRAGLPEIFRVKGEILDKLAIVPSEFRDARVAPIDRYRITELRIGAGADEKVLVKDAEANWHWAGSDGPVLGAPPVEDFLDALDAARAVSWIEGPEASRGIGAATPRLAVRLKAGEERSVEVRLGPPAGDAVLAASSASPALYRLEAAAAEKVLSAAQAIRAPEAPAAAASTPAPAAEGGQP